MGCWEFPTVNGVPRMHRDTTLADFAGATYIFFIRVVTYADFMAFVSLLHGNATEIWSEAAGNIYRELNFGGGTAIITGSPTTWHKIAFTIATSGATKTMQPYHQVFGGSFTTDTNQTTTSSLGAVTRMRFGANDSFLNDMQGTFRCAGLRIYQAELTSTEIQTEFGSRTPVRTTNCVFANPGDGVTAMNVDQSATAQNFTLTGTPTAISNDDPWLTIASWTDVPMPLRARHARLSPANIVGRDTEVVGARITPTGLYIHDHALTLPAPRRFWVGR